MSKWVPMERSTFAVVVEEPKVGSIESDGRARYLKRFATSEKASPRRFVSPSSTRLTHVKPSRSSSERSVRLGTNKSWASLSVKRTLLAIERKPLTSCNCWARFQHLRSSWSCPRRLTIRSDPKPLDSWRSMRANRPHWRGSGNYWQTNLQKFA